MIPTIAQGLTQGLIQCLVVMCAQGLIQYHMKTPFETLQCKQQLVISAILHVDAERRRHGKTIPTVDSKQKNPSICLKSATLVHLQEHISTCRCNRSTNETILANETMRRHWPLLFLLRANHPKVCNPHKTKLRSSLAPQHVTSQSLVRSNIRKKN